MTSSIDVAPQLTFRMPKNKPPIYLGLIVSLSLTAGTGGTLEASNLIAANTLTVNPIINVNENRLRRVQVVTTAQHLQKIRQAFRLNMSELAHIFEVSRPAAYAWLQGVEPKTNMRLQALKISAYADEAFRLRIPRIELFAKRPLSSGSSLIESLRGDDDVLSALQEIKRIADREAIESQSLRTKSPARPTRRTVEEVSVPIMDRG
jgi:DNA-binding transcriptional regulator YiaG